MKTKLIIAVVLPVTFVCAAVAADKKSSDEQAIRDLETQWSKAAGAKDLEKTISFYADNATVLPANATIANTKDAIRSTWKEMLETPGAAISWKPSKVEIAKSGDMAYATGTYELTMTDASGKPINDRGKYVTVWEKKGGTWKCCADIWNSDLPATPASSSPAAGAAEKK